MNLTPSRRVMNTEKLPIVVFGTMLAIQLPTVVKHSTEIIMIIPFFISRFLFLP